MGFYGYNAIDIKRVTYDPYTVLFSKCTTVYVDVNGRLRSFMGKVIINLELIVDFSENHRD